MERRLSPAIDAQNPWEVGYDDGRKQRPYANDYDDAWERSRYESGYVQGNREAQGVAF